MAGDLDPRQLLPVVVEDISGFTQAADDIGNTGPSDLAKAISDDGEPDAERVLKENGFRAGYQRLWTNDVGDELVVFVYQFCIEDGAERYADRTLDLFERAQLPIQPIVGTTVGTGFTLASESMRGLWLWETSGTVLVQVIAYSERPDDVAGQLQQASDLLAAQLDMVRPSETDPM